MAILIGIRKIKERELISGEKIASPEYEDCKQIAKKKKIPIRKVVDTIEKEVRTILK